jgi:hypothetical protein
LIHASSSATFTL